MSTYYTNEAAFDLPEIGFKDKTVTLLEAQTPKGAEMALMLQRFPLPVGKSLRETVQAHLAGATRKLRGWTVLFERDIEISASPAIELGASWRGEGGMVYTRQAHLAVGNTWLVVAGNAPLAEREAGDQVFEHVISTLSVRE